MIVNSGVGFVMVFMTGETASSSFWISWKRGG